MKRLLPLLAVLLLSAFLSLSSPAQSPNPAPTEDFRNPKLPVEQRVDLLIKQMTVDEKISQLMKNCPAIPRLGIPAYCWWSEALHGVARNGTATVFPQAIGLAATWDPDLHFKIADVISTEARAKYNQTIAKTGGETKIYQGITLWSPNINIFRDPRWGRGQETYGEDPFLTGRFGVAFVKGLQGNDPFYIKTVATVKHFAVHSGPESLRHKFDAVVSDRDLRETYLPAFEAGIREGGSWSLMSAYNAVDGIPAPANKMLLTDILRNEWGFKGAVVGDVDTVADIVGGHHYAKDGAEASALALKAGNDLCSGTTYNALPEALKRGLVTENDLDIALRRLFYLRFRLGQFDPPDLVPFSKIPPSEIASPAHDEIALQASRESIVMLKNDGILPWNPKDIKTLAVLGPTAQDSAALVGNYNGSPRQSIYLLQAIQAKLKPFGVNVIYQAAVPLVTGFRETGQPFPAGVLFSDEKKIVPGLKGELFNSSYYSKTSTANRTDEQVDLLWNDAQPVPGIPTRNAHLRWSGYLVPQTSGDYALSITFIGQAQLFLDDKLVAGEEKAHDQGEVRTRSGAVTLEAGKPYKIRLEFNQGADDPTGRIALGWRAPGGFDEAMGAARKADHILLTLGITPGLEGEEMKVTAEGFSGGDKTSILLPKAQRDLIDKLASLGKPFVVVLTNGSALSFDTSKPNAILESWYYGQGGGEALAETLVGENNPSGRLPITFYKSDSDLPPFESYSMENRTYRYFTGKPLFAFGFGLSYSTFKYDKATLDNETAKPDAVVNVQASVTNTSARPGAEVVQVYVHAVQPSVPMPLESLVGFQRVNLAAGETKTVSIPVKVANFRHWDVKSKAYEVDPGQYEMRVGAASDDIRQRVMLTVSE